MLHSCSVQTLPWKGAILCKYKTDWLRVATVDGPQPMSIKALFREIFNASLSAKIECMLTSHTIQQASSCEGPTYQLGGLSAVAEPGGSSQGCDTAIRLFHWIRARGSGPLAAVLPVQPQQSCCCPLHRPRAFLPPRGSSSKPRVDPSDRHHASASQACAVLLGEMCNTQSNFPFSSQNAPYVRTAIRSPPCRFAPRGYGTPPGDRSSPKALVPISTALVRHTQQRTGY